MYIQPEMIATSSLNIEVKLIKCFTRLTKCLGITNHSMTLSVACPDRNSWSCEPITQSAVFISRKIR